MEVSQELMDALKGTDVELVYKNGDAVIRRTLENVSFKRVAQGHVIVVGFDPQVHGVRSKRVHDLEDIRLIGKTRAA